MGKGSHPLERRAVGYLTFEAGQLAILTMRTSWESADHTSVDGSSVHSTSWDRGCLLGPCWCHLAWLCPRRPGRPDPLAL